MLLGTAFSDAVDLLSTDINLSVAGTFTPRKTPARTLPTGVAVPCRIILTRTDPILQLGKVGARNPGWGAMLSKREIPDTPREDDQITISEGPWIGTYTISTVKEDSLAPAWACTVKAPDA